MDESRVFGKNPGRSCLAPDHDQASRRSEKGVSFVEIVIVLALGGLILVISIPNLRYQRVKYRTLGAMFDLQQIHNQARFEALRRHRQTWLEVNEAGMTVTLWGDSTASPNGSLETGADELVSRHRFDGWLTFSRAGGGNAVDYFGAGYNTIGYRTDGSIVTPGTTSEPALYFTDVVGNAVRLRVNSVTGTPHIEMQDAGRWTDHAERWIWKY